MHNVTVGGPSRQHFSLSSAPMGLDESVLLHRGGALLTHHAHKFKPLDGQRDFTHEFSYPGHLVGLTSAARPTGLPADLAARTCALSNAHISPRTESPCQIEVWKGASLVQFHRPGKRLVGSCGLRGRVRGRSRQSRGRLMAKLARVRTADTALPFFATRTFPDHVPPPAEVPSIDDRFFKRLFRRFPGVGVFWGRELKERKSGVESKGQWVPHFHDLIWGVPRWFPFKPESGEWVKVVKVGQEWHTHIAYLGVDKVKRWGLMSVSQGPEDCFDDWMARNWYEVVGSGDLYHYSLDAHGRRHGVDVSLPQDGQAVRNYCTKPMRYLSKPEEESRCSSPYFTGARSWGVRGGSNIPWGNPVVVPITDAVFNCLMRMGALYIRKASKRLRRFRSRRVFVGDPVQWLRMADYFIVQGDAPF